MERRFGPVLRSERKRLGHSLQEFAEFLGTSVATLKRWEAGTSAPTEARQEAVLEYVQGSSQSKEEGESIHPGWLIRVERIAAELSIRRAAERCAIPSSTWHRFETGQSTLGKRQAERLAENMAAQAHGPLIVQAPGHRVQAMEAPRDAARYLVRKLLKSESLSEGVMLQRFEEFQSLAIALMNMGDHDLSGKAHRFAAKYGKAAGAEPELLTTVQIGSAWIGFPAVKERDLAANRLRWIDNKVMLLPSQDRPGFSIMRAMFLGWAGCPSLAHEVVKQSARSDLQILSLAWMEAKHGNVNEAMRAAEAYLEHQSPKLRFIANKVLLESLLLKDDLEAARMTLGHLQIIRTQFGFWSPDIANRIQRLTP